MKIKFLILAFIIALSVMACAPQKSAKNNVTTADAQADEQVELDPNSRKALKQRFHQAAAHDFFLRGLELKSRGNHDAALMFYQKAYEYDPSTTLAMEISKLYLEKNKYPEALDIIKEAVERNRDTLAHYYLHIGRVSNAMQQKDSAYKYYKMGVTENTGDAQVLYEYSMILQSMGKYEELTQVYDKLLVKLNYPEAIIQQQLLIGMMLKDDKIVINTLEAAWESKRTKEYGENYLEALKEAQNYNQMIFVLDEMANSFPEDANLYKMKKAHIFSQLDQYDSTAAVLKDLVKHNPDSLGYLRTLAVSEMSINQTDSAIFHLKQAIEKSPEDKENYRTYNLLSEIYRSQKDFQQAIEYSHKSLELKSDKNQFYNLSILYINKKVYDSAHVYLDSAIALSEDATLARFQHVKAKFYIMQSEKIYYSYPSIQSPSKDSIYSLRKEAEKWLNSAYKLDSNNVELLFTLASNFERLGKMDSSISLFKKIIIMDPTNHHALNYYGYLLVDNKLDLKYGDKLIDQALALDPESSAYIDSKAWSLYHQKKYYEAYNLIEKLKEDFDDIEYLEHKALILEKLDRADEATVIWKKILLKDQYNSNALEKTKSK